MPCSPVQVPSIASARMTRRSFRRSASASSAGIVAVDQKAQVEVAIADMPDQRRDEEAAFEVLLGLENALGQPGDRHAHVGRPDLAARAQRLVGVGHVVARCPQMRALFLLGGPLELAAAVLGGNRLAPVSACSFTPASVPWNSMNSVSLTG